MDTVDAIVVGAGVVGLAVARALALRGRPPLILEAQRHFGSVTSARNSEVIHAGIYYPPGTLKAALCTEGAARLYAFCRERDVPHRACGKLIVAANDGEEANLAQIAATARANGVETLVPLSGAQARNLEPALACQSALLSPRTGIIDSHAYMLALLGEAEAYGAQLVCNTGFARAERRGGLWGVHFTGGDAPVYASILVNCAGLNAQAVAREIEGAAASRIPALTLAKGVYFTYGGKVPFDRLIYPVPEPGGLGAHLTLDMAGQARFGPDVEWVDKIDYTVDPARREHFAASIQRFWPGIDTSRLQPAYAGLRPKLSGPGEPAADFVISGPDDHGLEGLTNLFGIESPGLTASMAIAHRVAEQLAPARAGARVG